MRDDWLLNNKSRIIPCLRAKSPVGREAGGFSSSIYGRASFCLKLANEFWQSRGLLQHDGVFYQVCFLFSVKLAIGSRLEMSINEKCVIFIIVNNGYCFFLETL